MFIIIPLSRNLMDLLVSFVCIMIILLLYWPHCYATPARNDGRRRPLQWLLTRWILIHILLIFYLQISPYTLLSKLFFVLPNPRPRRVLQQHHINGSWNIHRDQEWNPHHTRSIPFNTVPLHGYSASFSEEKPTPAAAVLSVYGEWNRNFG